MKKKLQFTDLLTGANSAFSFDITQIADLPATFGNFHSYNHKAIFMMIRKNKQGGYKN